MNKPTLAMRTTLTLALALLAAAPAAHAVFQPVTCRNSFTPEQEIAEGQKAAAQIYRQQPVLPENDPITRYVQNLGARLAGFAPLAPGVTRQWPFTFHVVASDEINAFALPGGSIFVNLATVQAADTEAQLAGVMAHEISHVVMRHSTCNLGRQQTKSLLYGLGAVGSAILLGNGAAGQLAQQGIGFGQNLDFLHMSRGDESQADLLGTNILYNAGYDPRGLPQFFETLQAKYGGGGAQFLSDHPNPGNRTPPVTPPSPTRPRRDKPTAPSAASKRAHALAAGRKALTSKEIQAGAWRATGQFATGPGNNGGVVPAAAGVGGQASASPAAAPLSRAQLGLDGTMAWVQGTGFTVSAPASWTRQGGSNGALTLAPRGGAGAWGVSYGVLIDRAEQSGTLRATTDALVNQLTNGSTGLQAAGTPASFQVAGRPAYTVGLRGPSPITANGTALPERDQLITVSRPDGGVSYLVFVAPDRDYPALKPTFDAMLGSFSPR